MNTSWHKDYHTTMCAVVAGGAVGKPKFMVGAQETSTEINRYCREVHMITKALLESKPE